MTHGGGCGCKVAPAALREIIRRSHPGIIPDKLLVGIETGDDAAVYQINDGQAIVATTDFFTPIVDDPHDFGAIAATNALSDVYAMGGIPLFALAVVGMPVDTLPMATIRRILEGGEAICASIGIPIAGGHTIDAVEPIYGLVAVGQVDPRHIKRNAGARPGDVLVLGKPLGVGVYGAALKRQRLDASHYRAMVAVATQLNTPGAALGRMDAVHALTDVTGFGLLGHLLSMCRASAVGARLTFDVLPLLPDVIELIGAGMITGASNRNWSSCRVDVKLGDGIDPIRRALLTDPQTSGGLLAACEANAVEQVLGVFYEEGFVQAAAIGEIVAGPLQVTVN